MNRKIVKVQVAGNAARADTHMRGFAGLSATLAAALAGTLLLLPGSPAVAHESEQYTLPSGRQFADLGPWLTRVVHGAVAGAANETNTAIAQAIETGQSEKRIAELQSSDFIAGKVWEYLFAAIPTNETLDATLISQPVQSQFPGLVTMYRPTVSIYDDPLLVIDLTKAVRTFFRAGSIDVGGTVFGTDKLIHFINIGRIYHEKYERRLARGMTDAAATQSAIESTSRNPLLSEDGVLGMLSTGIHSNGDLAADFAGLRFYINLTRPIRIGPREMPPMLTRDGPYWKVRVQPDTDFFTAFITPHWNEVFNPNKFVRYASGRLRSGVRDRCSGAVDWYRDEHGRLRDPAQFNTIARELSTYYGEDYGHESNEKSAVTIGDVCFAKAAVVPADVQSNVKSISTDEARPNRVSISDGGTTAAAAQKHDAFGRTPLWWAARKGNADEVQRLAANRSDVTSPDADGETPLHAATRAGSTSAVAVLLANGAEPNAAALYGVTPLMLAAMSSRTEVAEALLRTGAQPNARDVFGKTALHDAALRGNSQLARLLLSHGADPLIADNAGNTALRLAEQRGDAQMLTALDVKRQSARSAASDASDELSAQAPVR